MKEKKKIVTEMIEMATGEAVVTQENCCKKNSVRNAEKP